jgi:putative ABC transport system permease protein
MFQYYTWLAARSLRRSPALTALMVLAIGLGIGASITTLTVLRVLSGDPLPQKSERIFLPMVEPRGMNDFRAGEPPEEHLTYPDAMNLLKAGRAKYQAISTGGAVVVQPDSASVEPFMADVRFTTTDFFPMFETPFAQGGGWSAADDEARARVVVISKSLNEKAFGGADDTVGRTLRLRGNDFRVIGVLDHWRPTPHFYDLIVGNYSETDEIFVPIDTGLDLDFGRRGTMNCWDDASDPVRSPNCTWMQLWIELDSPAQRAEYEAFLSNYSDEQRALGRFPRPTNVRLLNLPEWLDYKRVVPSDVRLQVWLAFGFLAVCLINTVGLMLAKFLRRAGEIGVRRAIGASRRQVFAQFLVEAGAVGAVGALLGIVFAWIGLWAVRQQPGDYASLAHLDLGMLGTTVLLALISSLVAGLLPAWHACDVPPALQLKSD